MITEALGMKLVEEDPYWVELNCHGVRIGFHPEEKPIPQIPRDSMVLMPAEL